MSSSPLFKDRVLETSTTTGTGTYTLAGAVTGYQAWSALGNGNSAYDYAEDVDASGIPNGGWEVGLGTYTASGTTLSRDAILASSNSGSAVSWSAGTRRIGLCQAAAGLIPIGAVIAPTLLNSWVNYGGGTFEDAGYWKDAFGYVHLQGLVKSGTVGLATPIFVLPSGFRPFDGTARIFITQQSDGSEKGGPIYVSSNGEVATNGFNGYCSLDGVMFRAGQ